MNHSATFTNEWCDYQFSQTRTDAFFDALFGGAEEGAYDIRLRFAGNNANTLTFNLELHERPGKCLVCNLTYGLPQVFMRHPVINIKGLAAAIAEAAGKDPASAHYALGTTKELNSGLHVIPLTVTLL